MYLLIGVWGGPRRVYAATKFVLYTMVGSLPMLVAILYCAWKTKTRRQPELRLRALPRARRSRRREQLWCFAAFALAFAIKVPLFPVHTWLPDAHVEAPTRRLGDPRGRAPQDGHVRAACASRCRSSRTRVHAAAPLHRRARASIGIVYGALVAVVQADVKKLVAYSSVSPPGLLRARALRPHDDRRRPAASTRC